MIHHLEARDAAKLADLLERHVTGTTAGIARAYIGGEAAPTPFVGGGAGAAAVA